MAKIQRPSTVRRPSTTVGRRPSTVTRPSTSTSTRTSSTTKKTDPIITTKIVKVSNSFTLYGNRDATVEVVKRGNGDLNASNSRIVKVSATPPTLTYDPNSGNVKASVRITTQAWEKDYNKGSKRDNLKFSKTITQQLQVGKGRTEIGKGAKNSNNKFDCYEITEVTAVPFSPNGYGSVNYKSYYPGDTEGFRNLSPYDFPNENQSQEWMTMEDIQVQVNNKGSELSGTNNFAVKGVMNFYFKVTTKTWKEYTVDKATNKAKVVTKPGEYSVITDGKVLPSLKEVLGFGYDITGGYCDTSSIQHSVVNFDAVNQLKRIKQSKSRAHIERKTISGESLEEYSHKLESSLNVKVSAACFGASFSSDTTTTSSEETSTSENRKFAQFKSVFKNREYEMLLDYKNNLDPALLQPTFLDDLNISDAATIVEKYGTHVLLGGIFGASAFYNMSYIKSVSNMSTATSFTNTTSIGYSPTGGTTGGKEKTEKKSAIAKLVDELGGIDKLSDAKFKSLMETYQKELASQNKAKEDSKKSDSKPKQNSFSGTTTYTESETESFSFENETTNAFGIVFGGDTVLAADIKSGELEKIVEWEKKLDHYNIKQDNHVWCDFIPGTLIPIYEFIPIGYKVTPEDVRKEWTLYIESKGKAMLGAKQKMLRYPNSLIIRSGSGSIKNLAKELGHGDSDTEISTKDNKTTGWKVRFELVNLDNGNVAVVVQLTVGESGLSANRTLLMLHQPLEVTNNQDELTVIDTTKCKSIYEVSGNIYREEHKLIDVTRFFYDCPFLDFEHNKTNKVRIGIDGGGGDEKNLRLEIDNFYLPVLVNEKA
jgi:hypothetical protein